MNYLFFTGALNAVTSVALAALVFWRGARSEANIVFCIFCLAVSLWSGLFAAWNLPSLSHVALVLNQVMMVPVLFIPSLYLHFVACLTGRRERASGLIRIAYIVPTLFLPFLSSPLLVEGIYRVGVLPVWPKAGPLYILQMFSFSFFFITAGWMLYAECKSASGSRREQLRYSLIGIGTAFIGGCMDYAPCLGIPIYPWGNPLISVFVLTLAYSILQHHLFEINLAMRYGATYAFLAMLIGLPFGVLSWWIGGSFIAGVIACIAPLAGYIFISRWEVDVTAAVDRLPPFKGKYDRYKDDFVNARRDTVVNAPSLHIWAKSVLAFVRDILGVEQAAILVHDAAYDQFVSLDSIGLPALEGCPVALERDGPVGGYLMAIGDNFLLKDDIMLDVPDHRLKEINDEMALFSAQVCVPLRIQQRIAGCLMIGAKRGMNMFTKLDVQSLYRVKSGAEEALRSLLAGLKLQQFSSSWAHDLMHPFGPKGSFQLLAQALRGKHGPLPAALEKDLSLVLREVAYVWEHMGSLLNPLKHMAEAGPKLEFQLLAPAFDRTRVKYLEAAAARGIRWTVAPPPADLKIPCDADNLEHRVILNLVDNAFRYVAAGGAVELGHELRGDALVVVVSDTGPGVDPEKMGRLFERRVEGDEKTGGKAGWGLYNARTVVEAHGGRIWVESAPGKGAKFCFSLPLKATVIARREKAEPELVRKA